MKIIDLYENNEFLTDKDEIMEYMKRTFIEFNPSYLTIEPDGLVYDGTLILFKMYSPNLKVQFKEITGYCSFNSEIITSLIGCPGIVGDYFSCSNTSITSLKYCPQSIVSEFYCTNINIKDPKEYRYALYSEILGGFGSNNKEIDEIINTYSGSVNRKHWPHAINLLNKVKL